MKIQVTRGANRSQKTHLLKCNNCGNEYYNSLENLRRKRSHTCSNCRHTLRTGQTSTPSPSSNTEQSPLTGSAYAPSGSPFSMNERNPRITNKNQMLRYLQSVDCSYSRFILPFYTNEDAYHGSRAGMVGYEIHHIFPQSQGGPNTTWNQIMLSVKDHVLAHLYLAKDFKHPSDIISLRNMGFNLQDIDNLNQEQFERQLDVITERRTRRDVPNRPVYTADDLFYNDTYWHHPEVGELFVSAYEIYQLKGFRLRFADALPDGPFKQKLLNTTDAQFKSKIYTLLYGTQGQYQGWSLTKIEHVGLDEIFKRNNVYGKTAVFAYHQHPATEFSYRINSLEDVKELKNVFYSKFSRFALTRNGLNRMTEDEFVKKMLTILTGRGVTIYSIRFNEFI